ncbi:nucleoside diphosphate kinase regulator [Verrucomicrobiota bacterium sgz303538]
MKRPPIVITYSDHKKLTQLTEELRRANKNRALETLEDLATELNRAELKESFDIAPDIVTMNSVARVCDLDTGDTMELTLVYPDDANIDEGKVSILAPLGTAMLGYRAGDVFQWKVPAGIRNFKVEAVLFQPERMHTPPQAA